MSTVEFTEPINFIAVQNVLRRLPFSFIYKVKIENL